MGSKVGNGTQRGFFSLHFTFLVIFLFVSLHIQHSALVSLLAVPTVSLQALQDITRTKLNRRLVLRSRIQSVLVKLQLILCLYDLFQLLLEEQAPVSSKCSGIIFKE